MDLTNTYSSLHTHSTYSSALLGFADSVNKVEDLIQYCYDIGLYACSITDHEGISGHLDAENYYNEMKKDRPFKLIRGNEIYLISEEQDIANINDEKRTPYFHALLQAKDLEGHQQIRELSTRAWYRSYFKKGIVRKPTYYTDFEEVIGKNKGHLIFSTACIGGLLGNEILKWKLYDKDNAQEHKNNIHQFISWCLKMFGEDFYFEIQPCLQENEEQRIVNKTIADLSKIYNVKIICTTDAHYLNKENRFIHQTLLNSQDGDRESDKFYQTTYIMSPNELREFLRMDFSDEEINQFFQNTNEIADKCCDYSLKRVSDVPLIPKDKLGEINIEHCFKEYYDKYPNIKFFAENEDIYYKHFWFRVEKGLLNKVVNNKHRTAKLEDYLKRINEEFDSLIELANALNTKMACYYTTVEKVVELIYSVDSLVGSGRGSAGAWCTAYLLDITQCDSVEVPELQFHQRHLSAGRKQELPDCDIDVCANKRQAIIEKITEFWGQEHVVSVATFTTLSSKSSVDKACKGLGINDDVAGYLKSLIPIERMKLWTLHDCLLGNEKKKRKPLKEFVEEVNKYENLKECLLAFEGMIINRSSHAGGLIISNEPITNYNAMMRASNGLLTTQFELHQSEAVGLVKFDLLSLSALDMIKMTINLLVQYGYMEDKGSLRKTFNYYLNPDVLNYDNKEMWDNITTYKSLFQYESPMGIKAIRLINPKNIHELSVSNSVMRLKGDGSSESPMEKFIRYKNNIEDWYKDMKDFGLNENEMNILKKYLSKSYGVCESQEKLIKLTMDKEVAGFNLRESDQARKAVAKGSKQAMQDTEDRLYSYGKELGVRKVLTDYLWNVQFEMQKAYAFSEIHSYEYSIIALQQMNLNHFYPRIFWETSVLTIESESDEEDQNSSSTPYGKIATSICRLRDNGTNIVHPDINNSDFGFKPNVENNEIIIGLKAIAGIGDDVAKEIIENRPYKSFEQFYYYFKNKENTVVKKSKIIQLIKSGAFEEFSNNKINLMKWLTYYETEIKEKLELNNMNSIIQLKVDIPQELLRAYRFKKYVISKDFFYCNDNKFKSKKHYMLENKFARPYFEKTYMDLLEEEKDYYYVNDDLIIIDKSLEKVLKPTIEKLKEFINKKEVVESYNKKLLMNNYMSLIKNNEDVNDWSMEAISFYDKEHPLDCVNRKEYNISNFFDLSEEPIFEECFNKRTKKSYKRYSLNKIMGTIIDTNHNKYIISLLTPEGVVNVKFNKNVYSWYKQNISEIIEGKKVTLDSSWFERGNKITVCGYRNNNDFIAKKYANSIFQHQVNLITKINEDKTLNLQLERLGTKED